MASVIITSSASTVWIPEMSEKTDTNEATEPRIRNQIDRQIPTVIGMWLLSDHDIYMHAKFDTLSKTVLVHAF